MNNLGIIIQKTVGNGLDYNILPNIDIIELNNKFNESIEDERDTPGKVGDKPIFVLQNTENYRIYSLIIGTKDDGRSGFYAMRIFIPINCILQNFIQILHNIESKYKSNPNSISNDSQVYSESLRIIESNCKATKIYINKEVRNKNNFIYYDKQNITSIEEVFNSNAAILFNKLYAFQRPLSSDEIKEQILIQNINYNKYSKIDFNEVLISGDLTLLKKLIINGKEVYFNLKSDEMTLLKSEFDQVKYVLKENSFKKVDESGLKVEIFKGHNEVISVETNSTPQKSFFDKYVKVLILIGILLISILLLFDTEIIDFGGSESETSKEIIKPEADRVNSKVVESKKNKNLDSIKKVDSSHRDNNIPKEINHKSRENSSIDKKKNSIKKSVPIDKKIINEDNSGKESSEKPKMIEPEKAQPKVDEEKLKED